MKKSTAEAEVKASGKIRLMSKHEVLDVVGLSYPTIWQMMLDGKFPRSRELQGKACWLASEVEIWCLNRPVKKLKGDPVQSPPFKWTEEE